MAPSRADSNGSSTLPWVQAAARSIPLKAGRGQRLQQFQGCRPVRWLIGLEELAIIGHLKSRQVGAGEQGVAASDGWAGDEAGHPGTSENVSNHYGLLPPEVGQRPHLVRQRPRTLILSDSVAHQIQSGHFWRGL